MIEWKTGNLFDEEAEALVNTVNCVGVMGRGIALQFKKRYPDNFSGYAKACKLKEVQPGRMFVFDTGLCINPRYIINFPTKRHWRGKSRLEDIELGLDDLLEVILARNIESVALPPLGAGLGGLDWSDVRALIEQKLTKTDVRVIVFEPLEKSMGIGQSASKDVPKMTPGRAALVGLIDRYLRGLLDPTISLLELHKLMYFMQESGEPLHLKYTKAHYGPYAENLRHVLNAIEGHMITGYADGGDDPEKTLELVPGALSDANGFLAERQDSLRRFDRVCQLVQSFESAFGLELLATVHWVVTREKASDDVFDRVQAWNSGKKKFSERQVDIALRVLRENQFCA